MKRKLGEIFTDYQQRRRQANANLKKKLGTVKRLSLNEGGKPVTVERSGAGYRIKTQEPKDVVARISPARGKRHRGETAKEFQDRRKVCNAKRRTREKHATG
tara:strand:+ start:5883 stop:6188 length:306 start_codon:yes stop_codon:yes gene_type:complete